jgi:hypothetical protein
MTDAIERQLIAYNARDVDGFVACYAEDVVIEDAEGTVLMSGREAMRERYARAFASFPNVRAEIVSRIRIGSYVIDEERLIGRSDGDDRAVAIYRIAADGSIDRVRFIR